MKRLTGKVAIDARRVGRFMAAPWWIDQDTASIYVETIAYSLTFFFHLIPGITETSTRLPLGAPLVSSPEAPELQLASAILFLLFLAGATLQVLRLRAANGSVMPA